MPRTTFLTTPWHGSVCRCCSTRFTCGVGVIFVTPYCGIQRMWVNRLEVERAIWSSVVRSFPLWPSISEPDFHSCQLSYGQDRRDNVSGIDTLNTILKQVLSCWISRTNELLPLANRKSSCLDQCFLLFHGDCLSPRIGKWKSTEHRCNGVEGSSKSTMLSTPPTTRLHCVAGPLLLPFHQDRPPTASSLKVSR